MRKIEVTAKTRQEAIENALLKLGVERDEVHVEILDEGSSGFLGFGARPVRIQVTAEHLPDEPPARPQHAPRHEPREQRPRPQQTAQPQRAQQAPRTDAPRQPQQGPGRPDRGNRPERPPRPEQRTERAPRPERREQAERQERQEPRRTPRPEPVPREPISEDRAAEATSLLKQMIEKMGIEANVTPSLTEDGGLCLTIESPDSAILIGRKGRNLAAMQYLINRMTHRGDQPEETERIIIDVEGYLERRRTSLEEMARNMAERVRETGRKMRLKPLSPQERRIIHMTLQDDPDLKTYSIGEASERTVVIAPKESQGDGESSDRPRSGSRRGGRGGRRRSFRRPDGDAQRPEGAEVSAAPANHAPEES